jgi:methionyl-tRNA synthetase
VRLGEKYNADLANNLGNLVSRIAAMTERYRGGTLPLPTGSDRLAGVATGAVVDYRRAMDGFMLHDGAAAAFRLIDAANSFIAETQPWALAKDSSRADRLTSVLADVAEAVRIAAVLLLPIVPGSATEILRRIGEVRPPSALRFDEDTRWQPQQRRIVNEGPLWPRRNDVHTGVHSVTEPTPLPDQPTAPLTQAAAPVPANDRISIDDFMKVQLRVAKVMQAERVPKSKKLIKLSIDVGGEQRTVVAGIGEAYEPEALVGKSVVIVANLQPAKLMGIESNGMVLAASPDGGQPIVLDASPATPGTRVR